MSGDHIRAVRNNNPGNIEKGSPWQGLCPREKMTPEQEKENRFAVFVSPKWGFRALAVVLITYQDKRRAADGSVIDTIREAIERWAPPSENDTNAYISHVCKITGFDPNDRLDFHKYADIAPLAKAISTHECGGWFFSDGDLDSGLRLAGVEAPIPSLARSRTIAAQTGAGVGVGGGAVVEAISQAQDQVSQLTPYLEAAKWIFIGLVVLSIVVTVWARIDDWKRAVR
jgi:hypothetical protein